VRVLSTPVEDGDNLGIVELAGAGAGRLGHGQGIDDATVHPDELGNRCGRRIGSLCVAGDHDQTIVPASDYRGESAVGEKLLDMVQCNPLPKDLQEP
jgi:hypothetical protein